LIRLKSGYHKKLFRSYGELVPLPQGQSKSPADRMFRQIKVLALVVTRQDSRFRAGEQEANQAFSHTPRCKPKMLTWNHQSCGHSGGVNYRLFAFQPVEFRIVKRIGSQFEQPTEVFQGNLGLISREKKVRFGQYRLRHAAPFRQEESGVRSQKSEDKGQKKEFISFIFAFSILARGRLQPLGATRSSKLKPLNRSLRETTGIGACVY
jgi:hypothetical protein